MNYMERVAALPTEQGWDSYSAEPTSNAARKAAENLAVVPTTDGGVQFEIHANGINLELNLDEDGQFVGFLMEKL